MELKGPKTATSKRKVDLDAKTVRVLRDHLKGLAREGLVVPWVFCDLQGGPVRANNLIRRNFESVLERAGLRHITIHTLRHTAATMLLKLGVHPKIVSERLGHTKVEITLDRYSHVLETMHRPAVEAMERLLASCASN